MPSAGLTAVSVTPTERRAEPVRADHHQVIRKGEAMAATGSGQGPEGPALRFRGAESAPAPIADEDAARRPGGRPSGEDRTGRETSCLSPADGNDGRADEPVPIVEVERQRDLLPVMAEKISGELSGCRRTVDPTGKSQRHLRFGMRCGRSEAHSTDE